MRADHLLRTGSVTANRRLLAVTFTNRARDNLRNRLTLQLGASRARNSVVVTNFHQLSAKILEAHFKTIGIEPGFTLPNPSWQRRTLADITPDTKKQQAAKSLLADLNRQPLTDDELNERLLKSGDTIALEVENRRRSEHYIDYGDLQRLAQLTLRNERIATLFQSHFDAVLVDEFHDLSLQQFEISSTVCTRQSTYAGDPHQGIFEWAGAQPTAVHAELLSRSQETVCLDSSFRSSPSVLRVVNAVSANLGSVALQSADPTRWGPTGGHAYAAQYMTDNEEATKIVDVTGKIVEKHPGDTIGVICRASYRRYALERAFGESKHPV